MARHSEIHLYLPTALSQQVKTDSLFYEIFQTYPALFFELIGSPCPNPASYRFISQEVKQTSFRIDGVLVPPDDRPEQLLYFIEFHGYRDQEGNLYPGFFSEILMYLNDYRPIHDWCAIVIFTQRRLDPGLSMHYRDYINSPHFQRFYLDEMADAMAAGSLELGIVRLLGLAETVAAAEVQNHINFGTQFTPNFGTRFTQTSAPDSHKLRHLIHINFGTRFTQTSAPDSHKLRHPDYTRPYWK